MDYQSNNPGKAKVLVVDDELLVAADIKRIVEKAGHIVIGTATSAEEAIEVTRLKKPDLILMDIKLKRETDGVSAAEQIRTFADIPIIFLTAFSDEDTFERAKKIGPFGYLIKPFNSRELTIAVNNSLYKHYLDQQLRENEKKFRLFYENSPLPYHSVNVAGNILEINNAWLNEFGYQRKEVIGHNLNEFLTQSSVVKLPAVFNEFISSGELKGKEFEFIHKNGSVILISLSGKISRDENGDFVKTHCVLHNITARKQYETMLKEAKEKFELIFKLSPDAIGITDLGTGAAIDVNEAFEELFGYTRTEIIGKNFFQINLWVSPAQREKNINKLKEAGSILNAEVSFVKKNGSIIDCLVSAKIIELSGKPHILVVIKDITAHKQSESALRESENKMQSIFRAAPIGIGVVADRIFLQVNEEFCKMTGYESGELLGKSTRMIYPTDENFEYTGREKSIQMAEKGACRIEILWRKKDGSLFDVLLSATLMDPQKPESGEVFTVQDISERKKMENALIKSEAKSRELLDNLESAVMIVDTDGIWKYLNKKAAENLKGDPKDFIGKNIFDYLPRNIDKLSFIKNNDPQNRSDITEYEAAFTISGEEKYYLVSDQVLKDDDDKPYAVLSNSIDITSRKLAEEALKISEEKYRYLFNANHDAILVYPLLGNKLGNFIEANETATQLFGYTREELLKMNIFDLDKGISEVDISTRKKAFETKGKTLFETIGLKKDGCLIDVEISAFALMYLGKPVIMTLIRDITEKKKAEAEIKEREAKFSAFMNNLQGIAYIKDSGFRYVFVNKRFMDLFKLEQYDWIGKSDFELNSFPESVIEEIASHDRSVLNNNQTLETIEIIPVENEIHYWKMIKFPLLPGNSKLSLTAGVGIDITAEKRLEMAMNNIIVLNHELDNLTIDDVMKRCMDACEIATNSKISFFHFLNPGHKTIEKRYWSQKTMEDCKISDLEDHYPISEAGVWIECVDRKEPVVYNDYQSLKHKKGLPSGHVNLVRFLSIPIFEDDKITAIIGVGNKETDYKELDIKLVELISYNVWKIICRKKTEEDLKTSLIEKETLLRELYHRTKNNMQVISSMLLLQTFNSDDSQLNRVLIETSNRIKAMALVHEKLYQSKNLSKINLKDYIIDLVKFSGTVYNLNKNMINIKTDLEEIFVLIDYAVPCGLVINEILSNTFQNSFPKENEGELLIKLFRNEKNEIIFISHDNSISDLDYAENNSNIFGIELIKTIVEHQLGGEIEYNNEKGVYIKISFKDNQYKSRV